MTLSAVRLLAVYFATAGACLWLAHRKITRLSAFVALAIAFAPFLLAGRALVTGSIYGPIDIAYQARPLAAHAARMGIGETRTPLLSDVALQEIPWRKAVRESIKNGRLPLWNRFILAGEPLLAVQQPVVLHPATWIGMLLPLAHAWTFEMAFRIFLAALCAYLYLREIGCSELAALTGAAAWAFSDYMVFFLGYPLSAAAAPFPLLLLGLRRLARTPGLPAAVITVVSLLLILTSGHPETLLHAVAGSGIYFLFELARATPPLRWRALAIALISGIVTLGLSAVLLLPFLEALPQTLEHLSRSLYPGASRSGSIAESLAHAEQNVVPYSFGISGKSDIVAGGYHEPTSYAGSVVWPLTILGLLSRRREKWIWVLIGALGFAAQARLVGFADLLASLPAFEIALNQRLIFLTAFSLAVLAAFGMDELRRGERRSGFAVAAASCALVLVAVLPESWSRASSVHMPPDVFRERVAFQLVPLVLVIALFLVGRRVRSAALPAAGVLAVLLGQRVIEKGGLYPTYPAGTFYPPLESIGKIPRNAPDRMTAVGFAFPSNVSALYEVEDVRGYEAMTYRPLFETYPLWCVHQRTWFNRVDEPTRPFLSFLNVRYFFFPGRPNPAPRGWPVLYDGEEGVLLENPKALPRFFIPRRWRSEPDAGKRLETLSEINDFADRGVISEGPKREDWNVNGDASVAIESYRADRILLQVDAREPTLVASSITAWAGWKLRVDGERAPLLTYHHAFHAFRVSRGRHRVEMRYLPDSFVRGAGISLATLLAVGAVMTARRYRVASRDGRSARWQRPARTRKAEE